MSPSALPPRLVCLAALFHDLGSHGLHRADQREEPVEVVEIGDVVADGVGMDRCERDRPRAAEPYRPVGAEFPERPPDRRQVAVQIRPRVQCRDVLAFLGQPLQKLSPLAPAEFPAERGG